jgi:hypothetical protein
MANSADRHAIADRRRKAFAREKKRVLSKLRMLAQFGDTSDEARRERIERCRGKANLIEFGRTYLPHYFTTETQAEWHAEYIKTFEIEEQVVDIIAPRGEAKSTIGSFADLLQDACYGTEDFIVLAMENKTKATMQTWRILLELKYNELILNDFGHLVDGDEEAKDNFITLPTSEKPSQTRIAALGGGQSARGLISGPHRPSKFVCDDIESRKVARSPRMVEKIVDIIESDYLYAMKATRWKFRLVGTMICKGSVLDKISQNEEGLHLHYRAIENLGTPEERSTWEEHSPLGLLKKLMRRGISRFMAEKQGEPMETEGSIKEEWLRHWDELPSDLDRSKLIIQVDPSYTATGDFKAMHVVCPHAHKSKGKSFGEWRDTKGLPFEEAMYDILLDTVTRRLSTIDMFKELYRLFERYKPRNIWIEGNFAQRVWFENEYKRFVLNSSYGKLPLRYYTPPPVKKVDRIKEIEGPIQSGTLVFPRRSRENHDLENLIMQLVRYGEPDVNDDGPDCLAAAQDVLHNKEKFKRKTRT